MYAGLSNASGDYVTIIDADLQQRPEVVLEMVKILDENEEYEEDRIDELLCDLQDSLEAANEAMADVLIIAEELKELTGEDILSQLLQ